MPEKAASVPENAVSGCLEGRLVCDSVVCMDIKKQDKAISASPAV